MKKMTFEEATKYLGEVKPNGEYTQEKIKEIWKEQMRIEKERKHRKQHAKLQTLLDVCAADHEKSQNSY